MRLNHVAAIVLVILLAVSAAGCRRARLAARGAAEPISPGEVADVSQDNEEINPIDDINDVRAITSDIPPETGNSAGSNASMQAPSPSSNETPDRKPGSMKITASDVSLVIPDDEEMPSVDLGVDV